jgi:hypothetical protein
MRDKSDLGYTEPSFAQEVETDECFTGWRRYPFNLKDFSPMINDGNRYRDRLRELSDSLFSE